LCNCCHSSELLSIGWNEIRKVLSGGITVGFTRAAGAGMSLYHKADYKARVAADFKRR